MDFASAIPAHAQSIPIAHRIQAGSGHNGNHFDTSMNVAPKPDPSLRARLKPVAAEDAASRDRKAKMSTVDDALKRFERRFSGNLTENWLEHVNELERRLATKHTWTPKQFYYGLAGTLESKVKQSLVLLERGLEVPRFQDFIPDWFEPSQQEWRLIWSDPVFSMFSFRTRVALILTYFHFKYQAHTPHEVWDKFTHAMQGVNESVEEWGFRLDATVREVGQYGMVVSFPQYINQWRIGTVNRTFLRLLEEALRSDRYGQPPVVYDLHSFAGWLQRYRARALENRRLAVNQNRLLTRARARRGESYVKKRLKQKKPFTQPSADGSTSMGCLR